MNSKHLVIHKLQYNVLIIIHNFRCCYNCEAATLQPALCKCLPCQCSTALRHTKLVCPDLYAIQCRLNEFTTTIIQTSLSNNLSNSYVLTYILNAK